MCKERRNGKCGANVYVLVGEISGQELYVKVYIPVRTVCVLGEEDRIGILSCKHA